MPPTPLPAGAQSRSVVAVEAGAASSRAEDIVVEEPLEICVAGDPILTTLRTPGADHALALGLLFAEGIIGGRDDVGRIAHCGRPEDPGYGNRLDVLPGPGVALDPERLEAARRTRLVNAACGACGRDEIDSLLERTPKLAPGPELSPQLLLELTPALTGGQTNFARTGGLHAAAAITASGEVIAHEEDIGRHNAVDKVVGRLLLADRLPRMIQGMQMTQERSGGDARDETAPAHHRAQSPVLLAVSGRSGFEIVQKAAVAGFPALASISAASSLAIDTAVTMGLTLAAFVRDDRYTLYAHPERFGA
jgi:FdhD protein